MKKLLIALCPVLMLVSCTKTEDGGNTTKLGTPITTTYLNLTYKGQIYNLKDVVSSSGAHSLRGQYYKYRVPTDSFEHTYTKIMFNPPAGDPFTLEMTSDYADNSPRNDFEKATFKLQFKGDAVIHYGVASTANMLEVTDTTGGGDDKFARGGFNFKVDSFDNANGSFRVWYTK